MRYANVDPAYSLGRFPPKAPSDTHDSAAASSEVTVVIDLCETSPLKKDGRPNDNDNNQGANSSDKDLVVVCPSSEVCDFDK